ncbi:Lrp/AsnC family transcriptional regulator, partial [Klebsiella pneumoniae]|uniref:Lrp/AsnC family transcriptional regulator n=1 Tax=Klebsiella pneumoniae TaxID=573 RepID=UPI00356952CD
GIIRRKVALLDPAKLGLSVQVYVMIKIDADGRLNLDEVSEQLCRMDEVVECHMLMGSFDFLLRVMVVDMEEYLHFLRDKLNKVPYLSEVSSIVSLKQVKSVTEVPLM